MRQGLNLQAFVPSSSSPDDSGDSRVVAKRGRISGFSRQSRKRLKAACGLIDWKSVFGRAFIYFVTLTFSDENLPRSPEDLARFLEAFEKRFRRVWGDCSLILVRDYGARTGRLHFHAVLVSPRRVYKPLLLRLWGGGFVDVDDVWRDPERVISYVAKYCGKPPQSSQAPGAAGAEPDGVPGVCADLTEAHNRDTGESQPLENWGRWWFQWALESLEVAELVAETLTLSQFHALRRVVRRLLVSRVRANAEFWGFHAGKRGRDCLKNDRADIKRMRENADGLSSKVVRHNLSLALDRLLRTEKSLSLGGYRARWIFGYCGKHGFADRGFYVMGSDLPPLSDLLRAVSF